MVDFEHVIASIRCTQLLKFTNPFYDHPLASLIIKDGCYVQTSLNLKQHADEVAKSAHTLLKAHLFKVILGASHEKLNTDVRIQEMLSTIDINDIIKPSSKNKPALAEIVHVDGCEDFGDIIALAKIKFSKIRYLLCKRWAGVLSALMETWQKPCNTECEVILTAEKSYCTFKVTSKAMRTILFKQQTQIDCRIDSTIEPGVAGRYLKKLCKVTSVKHRNVALRVWNGDVLSNDRLSHMGLVEDSACGHCGEKETQIHVVRDCVRAKTVYNMLGSETSDWLGEQGTINDLELRLECLWHLVNNRNQSADMIVRISKRYIENVRSFFNQGFGDISINSIL